MSESVIEIKLGEEYKAKIEGIDDFGESVFSEVYLKAFSNTVKILKDDSGKEVHENYNNIIAFAGERGTGKTSAMLSFAGALKDKKENEISNYMIKTYKIGQKIKTEFEKIEEIERIRQLENQGKKIEKFDFYSVGVIDPSLLSDNSNILEIIIAKMFQIFKKEIETKNQDKNEDLKRRIIGYFETVYESIKVIKGKKDVFDEEALDALLKIAESTSLKRDVEKLINSYLEFMNNDKKNGVLVIEVDDIDLNTKHAYEMVEQIRKYLIIPNVVILMAVKIEQLEQIVENNYVLEFKLLLDKSAMSYDEIKNMTEKYLEKLIPLERRLYLPKLDDIRMSSKVKLIDTNGEGGNEEIIDEFVRKQIYLKTDMVFIDGKYIIPENLRGLIELIVLLEKMEDVRDLDNRKKSRIEIINSDNFIRFKEYIFENWIKTHLNYKQQNALKELLKRDVTERNKFIINKVESIYELLNKDDKYKERAGNLNYDEQEIEYQNIVNLNNNGANVSLGDLLFVLNKANRYKIDVQDKKFIYAIKMVYSIMLYELHARAETEKKNDSDYHKLLGGYLYNPLEYKMMRDEGFSSEKRDRRSMSVEKLKIFINEYYNRKDVFLKELENDIMEIEKLEKFIKDEEIQELEKWYELDNEGKEIHSLEMKIIKEKVGSFLGENNKEKKIEKIEELKNIIEKEKRIIKNIELKFEKNPKEYIREIFEVFRIKSTEFNLKDKKYRAKKEVFYNKESLIDKLEKSKNLGESEFDILGFLFNIDLSSKTDFYIGNVEIFEEILNNNYKFNGSDFLDHFKHFFEKYIAMKIDLKFGENKILELRNSFQLRNISRFLDSIVNEKVQSKFNDIFIDEDSILTEEKALENIKIEITSRMQDEVQGSKIKKDLENILGKDLIVKNPKKEEIKKIKKDLENLKKSYNSKEKYNRKSVNKKLQEIVKEAFLNEGNE